MLNYLKPLNKYFSQLKIISFKYCQNMAQNYKHQRQLCSCLNFEVLGPNNKLMLLLRVAQ